MGDATEQLPKEPRRERRRAAAGLRTIVERMADGIVIVDASGTILFANPAAETMFGRAVAELVGSHFGFPLTGSDRTEIEVVRRGGTTTAAELRVVEIEWEGVPASLVTLRDVTDRHRAEEQSRALAREQLARAEAEAASEAKSQFLAMMSHELRTPLNAIVGYTELLDLGLAGPLTQEQRQQLGRIAASGRHLLGLVNEVLDLARVEAGRLNVDHSLHRARDVAEATLVLVQPQAEERGFTLTLEHHAEGGEPCYVGDEDRVRQILVNLLSNAVKFTEPGGRIVVETGETRTPPPTARLHGHGAWVYFSVIDTGRGIAADQLESIFAPFVQASTGHTRPADGSGLGLTISRRLARLMGGDLTVRSKLGEGSTFTLWLPAVQEHEPPGSGTLTLHGREPRVQGLADIGEALLRENDSVIDAFVARLRNELVSPAVPGLRFSQLADHVSTLIAELAVSLVVLEESAGQPSPIMTDGSDIQRLLAERHGTQRAHLGWDAAALRREYALLREELDRCIRRCFLGERSERLEEALAVLARLLDQAERVSVRTLERAKQG